MQLQFKIIKQNIVRTDTENVVADSKNYLTAQFTFTTEEWAGKTKTALFIKGNKPIKMLLDENDCCEVPFEVIRPHMFKVSVFAGDLITADSARVDVATSGYAEGQESEEPTPDIYQQILDKLDSLQVGEVAPKQVAEAVETYLEENPVETLTEDDVKKIVQNLTDDMVTESGLEETLVNYAKKEDVPEKYDDTELKAQVIELEENIKRLGYSLALSIDENYIMSISLLNKEGAVLSTKNFDFPIESTVMNASYANGIMTLILQNGNEVPVNISNLVRGLVNDSRTIAGIDLKDDITADELIEALGIDNKVDKEKGKGLSTNDYDDTEKAIVAQNKEDISTLKEDVTALQNAQDITTTTDPTMQNSYPGRVLINEIGGGETQQDSTTGAQLLNYDAWKNVGIVNGTAVFENNGITITATANDAYTSYNPLATEGAFPETAKIEVSEGDTITISWEENTNASGRVFIFGNGTTGSYVEVNNNTQKTRTYTVPSGVTFVTFRLGVETAGETISYKNIMIAKNNTSASYEPFTGGIASPNLQYQQPIEATVVSEVKTVGKNLLKNVAITQTKNGVVFTVNNDGSVTLDGTPTEDTAFAINTTTILPAESYILSGSPSGSSKTTYKLYIDGIGNDFGSGKNFICSEDRTVRVLIGIVSGVTVSNLTFYPMIRLASIEDDTYEPYTETVQTLTNPITLYNHGGVKDTFNSKQKNKRFGVAVFDGSDDEKWVMRSIGSTGTYRVALDNLRGKSKGATADTVANLLCTAYTAVRSDSKGTYGSNRGISGVQSGVIYIYDENFNTSDSLDAWKAKLSELPIAIVYELAEEEIESLPTADQIALNSLPTYSTITHLSTDAEIEPTYELKYGTSEVGGYTLEGLLTGRNAEMLAQSNAEVAQSNAERLTALEAAVVSNI